METQLAAPGGAHPVQSLALGAGAGGSSSSSESVVEAEDADVPEHFTIDADDESNRNAVIMAYRQVLKSIEEAASRYGRTTVSATLLRLPDQAPPRQPPHSHPPPSSPITSRSRASSPSARQSP